MYSSKSWSKTTEPTSYQQIYDYMDKALHECLTFIDNAEIDYYQQSSTSIKLTSRYRPLSLVILQTWSYRLNELRVIPYTNDIRNIETVRELLKKARINTFNNCIKDENIILLERIFNKTTEQLNLKIPVLIDKILDCMNLMKQYFLSFYTINDIQSILQNQKKEVLHDELLETAYTYEKSRWIHILQVDKSLKIIREIPQRIQNVEGILLSKLSNECQDLAVCCNCTSFPYIFVLPECYNEARRAIGALRIWLNEDMNYTEFIQRSLKSLDKKYLEAKKALEISKTQLSQIKYRAESHHFQLNKLQQEMAVNQTKNKQSKLCVNLKEQEYTSKHVTFDVYTTHLNRLQKPSPGNHVLIKRFQKDIKEFSEELPKLKSQVNAMQTRIQSSQQYEQNLLDIGNENEKLDKEVQLALEKKICKEMHFNRMKYCRDIIRNIYRCRRKNDLLQKIFHNAPITLNNHDKNENDDLSKTLRIISKSIGRDWNRLYWQLPFHPKRGQEELSDDLKHINEKYHRGDVFQAQATDALNKWRRFHIYAKLDDLIHGLQQIHRFDIIRSIEENVIQPKLLLNINHQVIDLQKKEIEDLNQKLIRLFDKIRHNATISQET